MNSGRPEDKTEDAEATSDRAGVDLAGVEGKVKASSVRKAGEVVSKHPDAVLTLIRAWMNRDA